jgi:hypothetical protein
MSQGTNQVVPSRYDERILRLALGVEPLDAASRGRAPDRLRVVVEVHPSPLHEWRTWPPGVRLTDVLPPLRRHRTGRWVRLHDGAVAVPMTVRIDDASRRYVPRRLAVDVPSEADLLAEEADPAVPDSPPGRRMLRPWLHPGAAYDVGAGATGIRGRAVEVVDAATDERRPLRWVRVRATTRTTPPEDLGWAHGDDRGEFLLLLSTPPDEIALADDPVEARLTISALLPPPDPDPDDPLLTEVDPLWDLPVEPITPPHDPAHGQAFLPAHASFGPFDVDVEVGRVLSLEFPIT